MNKTAKTIIGNIRREKQKRESDWLGLAISVCQHCHLTLTEAKGLTLLQALYALGGKMMDD